jgi:signal transduction histidine kinase
MRDAPIYVPLVPSRRDAFAPAFLAVFLWTEIAFFWVPSEAGSRGVALALGTPMCAALLWRRRAPLASAVAVAALLTLWSAIAPPAGTLGPWLVSLVAIYSVAQAREPWKAVVGAALVLAATLLDVGLAPTVGFGDYAFITVFAACAWVAGRAMLARRRRADALAVTAASDAVADERRRIARELHDVVAHNVGVIVVQAQAARGMLDGTHSQAAEAVQAIEQTGREALTEMRRLVGLMRETEAEVTAPLPGLRHLDLLAEEIRGAGVPVDLQVTGDPVPLPTGVDTSGYRIVQEGLTNVLKHAGRARAEVRVAYSASAVELSVTDDGPGSERGQAHGLAGIRERVAIFDGDFDAGPQPGGGWRLRARLPL